MIPIVDEIDDTSVDIYHYSLIHQIITIFLFSLYIFFTALLIFNNFNIENLIVQFTICGFGFTFYLTYLYFIIRRYQLYQTDEVFSIKLKDNVNVLKDTYCVICLGIFDDGLGTKLSCNCKYYYHNKCIIKWLNINNQCPVGRCKISLINYNN